MLTLMLLMLMLKQRWVTQLTLLLDLTMCHQLVYQLVFFKQELDPNANLDKQLPFNILELLRATTKFLTQVFQEVSQFHSLSVISELSDAGKRPSFK